MGLGGKKSHCEEVAFEQVPEGSKGAGLAAIRVKSAPGRGNSSCKSPEVEASHRESSMAGVE